LRTCVTIDGLCRAREHPPPRFALNPAAFNATSWTGVPRFRQQSGGSQNHLRATPHDRIGATPVAAVCLFVPGAKAEDAKYGSSAARPVDVWDPTNLPGLG
jgi:hypothetical protein